MALKVDITNAMKGAMRARQKDRLKTIRLILSEIKRVEVDERIDIDDSRLVSICLLYTSPSPRDLRLSRMPSSA